MGRGEGRGGADAGVLGEGPGGRAAPSRLDAGPGGEPTAVPTDVQVAGLCRTGLSVALLLAGLGARTIALWDPRPVRVEDLGSGYQPADLGRPRAQAAERRLRDVHPSMRVFADHGPEPRPLGAVTVRVGSRDDPDLAAHALAADHPLLPVRVDASGLRVGPWTVPGAPGCLLCLTDGAEASGSAPQPGGDADVLTSQRAAVLAVDALRGVACPGATGDDAAEGEAVAPGGAVVVADASGRCRADPVTPRPGCACTATDQAEADPWSSSRTSGP